MNSTRTTSGRVARVALVLAALASQIAGISVAQAAPREGSSFPTSQGLRADGLRWQGIARVYQLRERAAGFPTPHGLRADGLRWQGIARAYQQIEGARPASTGTGNGFDWGDAGLGVAAAIGAMLLAGAGAIGLRKRGRLVIHA